MKPWIQWFLVLPAAFASYAAIQIILLIASMVANTLDLWSQFISSLVSPAAFVWVGSKTAPSNRLNTSICLTILISILMTIIEIVAIDLKGESHPLNTLLLITSALAGFGGAIGVCNYWHKIEHNSN
jgi:hypothetical protein